MASTIPPVADHMTAAPQVIAPHEPLSTAIRYMDELEIRHLPVVDGAKLVGIVSDRDVELAAELPGIDIDELPVEQVMTPKAFTVRADTPLNVAARAMAARKIGSAVVLEGKAVIGVLTTTDALAALVDLLEGKLPRTELGRTTLGPTRPKTRQPTREARR
jgi:acetoin utilization protein AcuB